MNKYRGIWHGKRVDNGEWAEGYLIRPEFNPDAAYIGYLFATDDHDIDVVQVDPATLGECTGLTDKNGKLIFEGDIVRFRDWHKGLWCWIGKVRYVNQGFVVSGNPNEECDTPFTVDMSRFASKSVETIGNIHDNPELL